MRYSFFLLLWLVPLFLSAQKNFRPGYIVNLEGDTTAGFIDYKEWKFSPTHLSFRLDKNSITKEYGVSDVDCFTIVGSESYRRSIVKISLHPAKLSNLGGRDTSWKIDTVFLKEIYDGNLLRLFSFVDDIKERFYVLEKGQSQPVELIMREYLKSDGVSLTRETEYRVQLKTLLFKRGLFTDEWGEKIDEVVYDEDDLKRIIASINHTMGGEQAKVKKIRRDYWFAGIGLQSEKIIFSGDHQMSRNPNVSHSKWLPRISGGVDLFSNPNVGKVYYRFEAGFQVNQSTLTTTLPDKVKAILTLSAATTSLRAQANYALYNSSKLKIPVGFGLVYNYMKYTKNQYKKLYETGEENNHLEDWLNLKTHTTKFFARCSVIMNNKIEASLVYSPSVKVTKTILYSVATSNMQLQIYYLFWRK